MAITRSEYYRQQVNRKFPILSHRDIRKSRSWTLRLSVLVHPTNQRRSFSVVVRRKRSKDKVRQEKKYEALEAEFFRFLATNGGGVA